MNAAEIKDTRQYGITGYMINSIALYVYNGKQGREKSVIETYNGWAAQSGIRMRDVETAVLAIDLVRQFLRMDPEDLRTALKLDGLITWEGCYESGSEKTTVREGGDPSQRDQGRG